MISLIDLIFPKICVGCDGEGQWLCEECYSPLFESRAPSCADCHRLTPDGRYCRFHAKDHVIKGLITVSPFHSGTLREAIHTLKYNKVRELSKPLGQLLEQRLADYPKLAQAIIIPIPLHAKRFSERGFNQAELIARELSEDIETKTLIRYRGTKPQADLSHEARRTNLDNVYGVRVDKQPRIKNKTILLIDDVATTGTTLDAAAAILKKAGARTVWAAVIAKG